MKKIWLILSAVLLAAVAVLLVILLLPSGNSWESDDDTSRFPYSYTQNSDGLLVTITGEFPEGYAWQAESDDVVIASVEADSQDEEEAEFQITAVNTGHANVTFRLTYSVADLESCLYRIHVTLGVDGEGQVNVVSNDHTELDSQIRMIEDGAYAVCTEESGKLCLAFFEDGWYVGQMDTGRVDYAIGSDRTTLRFWCMDDNKSTVLLRNDTVGKELELEIQTVEGRTKLESCISAPYVNPNSLDELGIFRRYYNSIELPKGATAERAEVAAKDSLANPSQSYVVGMLDFRMNNILWHFQISDYADLADLCGKAVAGKKPDEQQTYGETDVDFYQTAEGVCFSWVDDRDRTTVVTGDGASLADAKAIVESMLVVIDHG